MLTAANIDPAHLPDASTVSIKAYVAGIMFEDRFVFAQELTLSHRLKLVRQYDNAHDPNAIQVVHSDMGQIGFVPRQMASMLASRMDAHQIELNARVIELQHEPATQQVKVQIEYDVPQHWLAFTSDSMGSNRTAGQPIYHLERHPANLYLLLNCSADQLLNIRDTLPTNGIEVVRSGYSTWPSSNGVQYEWYIKLEGVPDADQHKLAQLLEKRFGAISDEQRRNQLDELTRNYKQEVTLLDTKLRQAEQEKREVWRLGSAAEAEKQREIDQLKDDLTRLNADHDHLKQQAYTLRQERASLNQSLFSRDAEKVSFGIEVERAFLNIVADTLTPRQSLEVIQSLFADRIVLLPSAIQSAQASEHFHHRAQLFRLLWKLAKEYWPRLINNQGDTEARAIFGDDFAARESESTTTNAIALRARTFEYQGQPLVMLKHLRIGVKQGVHETIRVHFEWLATERKLVIGHCGSHLPTAG